MEGGKVVVVGGGVIGASVAYHLAKMGWTDVALCERDRLTSGTTWHSAGLIVTFGSTSETSTEMRKYTRDLYSRLEAETGQHIAWKKVGSLRLAGSPERWSEIRRSANFLDLLPRGILRRTEFAPFWKRGAALLIDVAYLNRRAGTRTA